MTTGLGTLRPELLCLKLCCLHHPQASGCLWEGGGGRAHPPCLHSSPRASEQGCLLDVAQGLGCGGGDPQGLSCVQTLREIMDQEHNVAALKQAIRDKEAPLKVAQTRLYQRSHRPNVELCRDAVQFRCLSLLGPSWAGPGHQPP